MKEWAELIQAIADLLWPVLAFVTVLIFRKNVRELLNRLKKGKLFGQEVELEASLKVLEQQSTVVAAELPPTSASLETLRDGTESHDSSKRVIATAATSPKAALILLASEIEKHLRLVMATSGHHTRERDPSARVIASYLGNIGWLTQNMVETIHQFREVRNAIVHGYDAKADHIISAIDSGITILKALEAIPHEINTVYHPGVDVFSDKECTKKLDGVRGVILETTSPGGTVKSHRIYPTTRTSYVKGRQVAWEWNMGASWGPAWFRDPDTGEKKEAWAGSTEFIGRHVDEV
jgi:hypothetical protein